MVLYCNRQSFGFLRNFGKLQWSLNEGLIDKEQLLGSCYIIASDDYCSYTKFFTLPFWGLLRPKFDKSLKNVAI
jgi:hypothetical protein